MVAREREGTNPIEWQSPRIVQRAPITIEPRSQVHVSAAEAQAQGVRPDRAELISTYGRDLGVLGASYNERGRSTTGHIQTPDQGWVPGDQGRLMYSQSLITELRKQPEDQQVAWLAKFLKDVDDVAPPGKRR